MRNAMRSVGIGAALALAYIAAARLGFRVAFLAEQVTTVWAPTGIAQAALLLWGLRLWPAVWIGAFLANAATSAPIWTDAGVATGNTLEALAAAWSLSRLGFDPALCRTRDVIAFIILAAIASPMVSATIGVTTLSAGQVQPWSQFWPLWFDWVLGDALGALVVAPVVLTVFGAHSRPRPRQRFETIVLVGCVLLVAEIVFRAPLATSSGSHPLEFVIFPFIIVAAVRLGQPATALVVLGASGVTIWNTIQGRGPFATPSIHQSLILLQVFMGVLASSGLVLAAAIAERRTAERRRAAAYAVGQVLTSARSIEDAAPGVLAAVCRNLDWRVGALWTLDPDRQRLRALSVWPADDVSAFAAATRTDTFSPGRGLPGRVWASGEPAWIEDVIQDVNFPRAPAAREAGLHGAFGFPIRLGDEVLGVVECFRPEAAAPDADLLAAMAAVGNQIGQFIGRTRIESVVRDSESRIRAILDTALDAIVSMDHQGVITDFNPAAERIFGYPRAQAIGRELAALLIPPGLRDRHRSGLQRYLSTGEGPFIDRRIETTAVHADGREFPVEIAITAVPSIGPPMFTGFVLDVTERTRADVERRQLLERERVARHEAETASRAKDIFLATLSHELRTPMTAIVGWTRMLLTGAVEEQNIRHALEVIDRNAQIQVQLVGDLLDVSQIITGGLKLVMEPVELRSIIEASLDVVHPAAQARQITVRSNLPPEPVLTIGDASRLQQIVWNLLANAVKFTPQGGRVQVDLVDGDDRARIRIQDNGPGIAPDFLPYLFERFRQADSSSTRQYGGLGLGLAIVRHLVELHGGSVSAENDGNGTGAVFTVELLKDARDGRLTGDARWHSSSQRPLDGVE
jgi:PAS domain S-box-containing protein